MAAVSECVWMKIQIYQIHNVLQNGHNFFACFMFYCPCTKPSKPYRGVNHYMACACIQLVSPINARLIYRNCLIVPDNFKRVYALIDILTNNTVWQNVYVVHGMKIERPTHKCEASADSGGGKLIVIYMLIYTQHQFEYSICCWSVYLFIYVQRRI